MNYLSISYTEYILSKNNALIQFKANYPEMNGTKIEMMARISIYTRTRKYRLTMSRLCVTSNPCE